MQIACYELYEEEKKRNEGKHIGELYHQKYKLSEHCIDLRYHNWEYTSFVYENTEDNIIVYFNYTTQGFKASGGHGRIEYNFYIIENNGKYYIQYFDMQELESKASKCGEQAITNLAWCKQTFVGVNTAEYRQYVLDNAISERIPVDKSELEKVLNSIQEIDLEHTFTDYLEYTYASTKVEMLDFKNKTTFYSDEFVLPKFKPYIRFIEFVFEKSKNPELQKCNLKYIDSLEEAKEILIDKKLKSEYCID